MSAFLRRSLRTALSAVLLLSLSSCTLFDPWFAPSADTSTRIPAAVASAHPLATQAGLDILAAGGNAVDAAIAVAASLGVVEPYSAGIGGGGFWLLYDAGEDRYRFIDARETAPAAAHRDYYLDAAGRVNRDRAINGPSAAGIPGQPAAFAHLSEHHGQLPLSQTLAAAIQQARDGFAVDEKYRSWLSFRLDALRRYPESARIFLHRDEIPAIGHIIRQPDLADTLTALARQGHAGFYQGAVAERLLDEVQRHGGDWSAGDLADYRVIERQPLQVQYGELEVISAP
ncbi:gamma-glutamyltransferase, partial [Candidatus Falkowbacteria bacterium]|nr:gamma-glutamyltransferase [Candidatus Falkowbacteria bacterium]